MTVSSLEEALPLLRAPFPRGTEQYRAGPTWEQDGVRWTRPLPYIDARAVFARLDEVVGPAHWSTDLERLGPGCYMCRISVMGVQRTDVGQAGEHEGEQEKSGASDAIKRAAVQHGIGAYLYDMALSPVRLEQRGADWVLPRNWAPATAGVPRPRVTLETRPAAEPAVTFAPGMAGGASTDQIDAIGHEMQRVGWSERRGRTYLKLNFAKESRIELTAAEAERFVAHLQALPSAVRLR